MKGTLLKDKNGWFVRQTITFNERIDKHFNVDTEIDEDILLHPTNVQELNDLSEIFDNLEARINVDPIVNFQIVEENDIKYAKIKNYGKSDLKV